MALQAYFVRAPDYLPVNQKNIILLKKHCEIGGVSLLFLYGAVRLALRACSGQNQDKFTPIFLLSCQKQ